MKAAREAAVKPPPVAAPRPLTVSAIQSSYIPWKGYFHIIQKSDVFVCLEDVQYTTRDWRNRNRIKGPDGRPRWLTVPVRGGRQNLIHEVRLNDTAPWRRVHLESLRHSYARAPFFHRYFPALEAVYRAPYTRLVDLNFALLAQIAAWLGIRTRLVRTHEAVCPGRKDDKLIALVRHFRGTRYLSGPSARAYMVPENYAQAGIAVEYMNYDGYPEYPQLSAPFIHEVTVLDLLFMTGDAAPRYIWGDRAATPPPGGAS